MMIFALAASVMVARTSSAQPSQALFGVDGGALEYKAVVETRADLIDDIFNASAGEGWRPRFVLEDRGRYRLLLTRLNDEDFQPREYKAETLPFADDIAARFAEVSQSGWRPLFVFPAGLRYRMLFERDKAHASHVHREYRDYAVGDVRDLDDAFNAWAADGWRVLFLLATADSARIRLLLGREHAEDRPTFQYQARTVRSPRLIDDVSNEMGTDGWRPIFTIPHEGQYRLLFEKTDADHNSFEYRAIISDESRDLDDALNRYARNGWRAADVLREAERRRYRVLLARPVERSAGDARGMEQ